MKLLRNNEIQTYKWDNLLLKSPHSSPFQTLAFYNLYNSVQGFSAEVFAIEESGDLKSLCVVTIQNEGGIRTFFSRRAIIYGGPLFTDSDYESVAVLLNNVYNTLNKRVIYLEVRNYSDYSKFKPAYINDGWIWLPYMNVKLLLKDNSLDHVLGLMKYNRRREIKQSLKEGAIYREANNKSEVENLFLILKELYSKKVKLPLPDIDFFLGLYESSIAKVFIVFHNNKIIGGAFCIFLQNKSIYTMYYCGLRHYSPKIFPSHLAIMAAIDFGIKSKLEILDFMGAGLRDQEYGVRKYKLEFGGELVEYGRFRKVNKKLLFIIGKISLWGMRLLKN